MDSLDLDQYAKDALAAGCPPDQVENFTRAAITLHARQLAASAAARLCDLPNGPTHSGYGGARGGGKSHWLLAQIAADDCQRYPGLKVLLLRKSAKTNREGFEDLRQTVLPNLKHSYSATTGIVLFENGSRILIKHYQHEKEISESFLGMGYDIIAIEEATTLTEAKMNDIQTCSRTSKPGWRPRIYSTTNPGGVGHEWYYRNLIVPCENGTESTTRFIRARVQDNKFVDAGYEGKLAAQTGWRRAAWLHGDWGIASGQFFDTFRPGIHVLDHFNDHNATEWFAAMDYGFSHYTVVLLACLDYKENIIVVDEFSDRHVIPTRIDQGISAMLLAHRIPPRNREHVPINVLISGDEDQQWRPVFSKRRLFRAVAGGDLFARQYDGTTLASQFPSLGCIRPANLNRAQGWAEIQRLLGDPDHGIEPKLFIHKRCERLLNCLPYLQHDPDQPADVLKSHTNDEGLGSDDAADALRYLVATPARRLIVTKLRGL